MSKKYIIELEAKVDRATGEVEELRKEIQKLNQEVVKSNKKTEDGIKGVESASNSAAKSLRGIGTAIKAIGIGLLLEAFSFFKQTIGENQKAVDLFNTVLEATSLAFNDLINFFSKNLGVVTGFFKATFEDPIGSIKQFGKAIFDGVIARVEQAIEAFGFLASAAGKLISGDFAGAMMDAKQAGKEFFDVITGEDGGFEAITGSIGRTIDAVVNYTKTTINSAKAIVELNKQAEISRVLQQGLVETYDRQAEKLRQIRDDDRNTISERIKANNELKAVLDEQEEAMLKMVNLQIASAQAQFNKNQNQQNYIALLEATQEREAVLAQIEGFRSEQLSNDLALQREQLELTQSQIDSESQRAIDKAKFDAEFIQGEVAKLEALKQAAILEAQIEEDRLTTKRNLYKEGTQAFIDAQNELLDFQQANAQNQKQIDRDITEAKLNTVSQSLGQIANLLGENSKFGKALAVGQAIIDTYVGANKALAQGGIFGGVAAAGVIASGLANVRTILSTRDPSPPSFASGGAGGQGSVPAIPPAPPAFNVVGASSESQLAQAIGGQSRNPVKAYVVSGEVTTAQALERNTIQEASI